MRDALDALGGAVRVQFAHTSPYTLEPLEATTEGIMIASYRDLCRGKVEAICGRSELRDFIDVHCILHRPAGPQSTGESVVRTRVRDLISDVLLCDPGMTVSYLGQAFARGRYLPRRADFPLRLHVVLTDETLGNTGEICVDECARMLRESVRSEPDSWACVHVSPRVRRSRVQRALPGRFVPGAACTSMPRRTRIW